MGLEGWLSADITPSLNLKELGFKPKKYFKKVLPIFAVTAY